MFWRTFATTVALYLVIVAAVTAHDSVSDRAVLTLRGTVSYQADVSILAVDGNCVVNAVTNTPGGLALSIEVAAGAQNSSLTINGVPAHFEDGSARVANVRPGTRSEADGAVAIAYGDSSSPLLVLDVAAR